MTGISTGKMTMKEKIIMTAFTDPMMGLSYESEPVMERLKQNYGNQIEFRYVMSLLVRDVSDFMTPEERMMDARSGIRRYCERLAGIYKSEEAIGGLPINMDGFRLFDADHRSSKPLNLAYKAAQLADPGKSETFLTELRHATVIDCFPTTHFDEILKVVRKVRIDETSFIQFYQDGSAEKELEKDLEYMHRLKIHSLPAYLIQYDEKALIMQSFDYNEFNEAIKSIMQ